MNSTNPESIRLLRDVDAYMVPSGDEVKLLAGNLVKITQALGGNYTVIMNGNICLLYTSPSPRDPNRSRMPSSA